MCELVDGPSTENLQRAVAPHLGRVYRLPQIGFCSVYRLPSLPEHRGRSHYMSYFRSEPAYSHAHGHRATFVSVSMAPSRWAFHAASITSEGAAASSPWAEHGSSNGLRTAVASPLSARVVAPIASGPCWSSTRTRAMLSLAAQGSYSHHSLRISMCPVRSMRVVMYGHDPSWCE